MLLSVHCKQVVQVRKHADKALEVLMDTEPSKAPMIRELKFKTFNQEWLEVVEQSDDDLAPHNIDATHESTPLFDDGKASAMLNLAFASPKMAQVEAENDDVNMHDDLINVELPEDDGDTNSDRDIMPEYM
jgi:hypothetical protein